MTRKIFRSILLVAGVVLAAGMVIMTGCLYSYFGGVQEQQLQDELSLAVSGVENGGTAYLERLPAERFRLTWIASDGSGAPAGKRRLRGAGPSPEPHQLPAQGDRRPAADPAAKDR